MENFLKGRGIKPNKRCAVQLLITNGLLFRIRAQENAEDNYKQNTWIIFYSQLYFPFFFHSISKVSLCRLQIAEACGERNPNATPTLSSLLLLQFKYKSHNLIFHKSFYCFTFTSIFILKLQRHCFLIYHQRCCWNVGSDMTR